MSSVMPFAFNAVELYVVTINGKPWTRAKEVCKALEYQKTTKTEQVVRAHCSSKNIRHMPEIKGVVSPNTPLEWPKNSQPDECYINEEGMYEFVFSSHQPLAKRFRKHCCNVTFPHIHKRLVDKMQEDHQKAIGERDTRIQAIECEIRAKDQQIEANQERIEDLIANRHVPRSGAIDTVLVVVEKNADEDTKEHKRAKNFDKYMLRCQKKQVDGRLSVLRAKYPNMVLLEPRCDDGNAIHVWNRFKQRVLTKENYFCVHFRLPPDAEELFEDMFGILV